MKSQIEEEDKEKEFAYMDMNGVRQPGFFAKNTVAEKEKEQTRQEQLQIAPTSLN